jgi:uncharacterized protein (DUF736 family)
MIIGNFVKTEAGEFVGAITTLTLHQKVVFRPLKKVAEKEPDYRLWSDSPGGMVEFGAAWQKRGERGSYLSVSIEDPALPVTLNAFLNFDGETATLVWNRPKRRTQAE